jgi:hypothetical protein
MPTAHAIASDLRKFADTLDKQPEQKLITPRLSFYHHGGKDLFIALSKVFPSPLKKGEGYRGDEITLTHQTEALTVYASIEKSSVCVLVEEAKPAKYSCVPILSLDEEEEIEA